MRCRICGRKLIDALSVWLGIGPECAARRRKKPMQECLFDLKQGKDIVMVRAGNGQPVVNIPHALVRHSPDGFEWGYGGSGPSDLALNILLTFTDQATADRLCQDFKREFIASIPPSGGRIMAETIRTWLAERM